MVPGGTRRSGTAAAVLGDELAPRISVQAHRARVAKAGLCPDACPHGLVHLRAKS